MKFTPWPYQDLIIERQLDVDRGNDWAGMGLGKTVSTLTSIDTLQLVGYGPALVLAPKRVAKSTWPKEARKWDHLAGMEIVPIIGTREERLAALRRDVPVMTINYDMIPWLIETLGTRRWPFEIVVADESTRLKGFRLKRGAKRAAALARIARKVKRWINLTGTPAPNGVIDLWGQQWFVDQGERLGLTFGAYKSRWFMPERIDVEEIHHIRWVPMPSAQTQIEDKLRDCTRTIRAKDWFDLEEPIIKFVRVDLPTKARRLYDEMEQEMYTEIENNPIEALNPASKTNKCRQIANGAAFIDKAGAWREVHDIKLQALEEIVEEAAGMPVLVAYQYIPDRERILKAFPQARLLDDDTQTEDDWNAGKIPMLVAHPKSAGHGLNLQDGSNIIVFFGMDWNLEEHDQIIERIGPTRQLQSGHDRPVFIYYILANRTVDNLLLRRIETKRSTQDILLEGLIHYRRAA